MDDFRLRVFIAVAKNGSFTKAANEVYISQPAVTKHIKNLEDMYSIRLFERNGNNVMLTNEGKIFLNYALQIQSLYQDVKFEIAELAKVPTGSFMLGASTTIAQYLIAPVLAKFYEKFPNTGISLRNGNTERIEEAILDKSIELGIVEGIVHRKTLKYTFFTTDELVVITHKNSFFANLKEINLHQLLTMPIVLRERGSGTLEAIEDALDKKNIKLNSLNLIMHLGSSESIKSFLEYSNTVSILSMDAVTKEIERGEIKVIPVSDFAITRTINFVHLQGTPNKLSTIFMQFVSKFYNQKL